MFLQRARITCIFGLLSHLPSETEGLVPQLCNQIYAAAAARKHQLALAGVAQWLVSALAPKGRSFRRIPSPQTPAAWLRREELRWRWRVGSQGRETETGSPTSLGSSERSLCVCGGGLLAGRNPKPKRGAARAGVSGPAPICGVQLCPPAPRSPGRLL